MGGTFPLVPFPVFADPNQQAVHANATVSSSGSNVFTGFGATEINLFINVKANPTGSSPTLQYTIQEVDPGDGTTVIGSSVSSTVINAIGIQKISLPMTFGGSIKVSWVIGGSSSPTFTQVYATLTAKNASVQLVDNAGASLVGQKAMASSLPVSLASDQNAPVATTGTITALNGTVSMASSGYASGVVILSGTWSAALVVESSSDGGTTWAPLAFVGPPPGMNPIPTLSSFASANGTYQIIGGPGVDTHIRVRAADFTSGTVGVRLVLSPFAAPIGGVFADVQQNVMPSIYNNSTVNLASGASFTGSSESALGTAGLQISFKSDQQCTVTVQQSPDGTNWDIVDSWPVNANIGFSTTVQAVSTYYRTVVTNNGASTTTYLRLRTYTCPIVEAVPRALGPSGGFFVEAGVSTGSWVPATPSTYFGYVRGQKIPLQIGADGTLQCYSMVLTDCGSFRDDFTGSALTSNLTGTVLFTNGSVNVTGTGCAFTTELDRFQYIKNTGHAEGTYAGILRVIDDNNLILSAPYAGATVSGTAVKSSWDPQTGSGGSISVANSLLSITSGTTLSSNTWVQRGSDYGPMYKVIRFSVSQRIANQTIRMGFFDSFASPKYCACVELTGTNNTQVTLVTRSGTGASDVESVTVTLPSGVTTASLINLVISVTNERVTLYYDPADGSAHVFLAMCRNHIPPPYTTLLSGKGFLNTGTPASSTTLNIDLSYLNDYNILEVNPQVEMAPDADVSTCTNVSAAVADTTLLAANKYRKCASVFNDSTATLYLKWGSGASTTSYTARIGPGGFYELPMGLSDAGSPRPYNGQINGYWSAATGTARVTESV